MWAIGNSGNGNWKRKMEIGKWKWSNLNAHVFLSKTIA